MKPVGVVFFAVLTVLVIVGTSVDLNIPNPILTSKAPGFARIILKSFGGDGTAEVEALIGDKILDFFVYQHLLTRFKDTNVDTLTMLRNSMVSNERLAAIGEPFVVPHYMSPQDWREASVHDKGTAIECIIGRMHLSSDANLHPIPQFAPALVRFVNDVLNIIQENMQKTRLTTHILEPIYSVTNNKTVCVGERDPIVSLFEWLRSQNVNPKTTISIHAVPSKFSGYATNDMFVAKFRLRQPQLFLQSPPQLTEKRAKIYVCKMALQELGIDTTMHLSLKQNHATEYLDNNVKKELEQKKQAMDILASATSQVSKYDTLESLKDHARSLQCMLKKDNLEKISQPIPRWVRKGSEPQIGSSKTTSIVSSESENNSPSSSPHKRQSSPLPTASEVDNPLQTLNNHLKSKFGIAKPSSTIIVRSATNKGVAGFVATFELPHANPPIVVSGEHHSRKPAARKSAAMAALKALGLVADSKEQQLKVQKSKTMSDVKDAINSNPIIVKNPIDITSLEDNTPYDDSQLDMKESNQSDEESSLVSKARNQLLQSYEYFWNSR